MADTIEYGIRPDGLGIILIELCFLVANKKHSTVYVPTEDHMLYDLKRIFNISDEQMSIVYDSDRPNHPASSDLLKTFSPYYTPDTVNLFGRTLLTNRRKKPCIGLAMHHGQGLGQNTDPLGEKLPLKVFPYNKYATYDTYSKIIKFITDAGYDVITFNSKHVDVEYKTFLLNELCECVISYEGGTAHLAHMLKVPTIMLPWNYWYDGDDHWKDGSLWDPERLQAMTYHLDRRTYFLKSHEEILAWDINKLNSIIDQLHNEQGNNIWLTKPVVYDTENLSVKISGTHTTFDSFNEVTRAFIKEHILDIKFN
jgi:hypothetical protein